MTHIWFGVQASFDYACAVRTPVRLALLVLATFSVSPPAALAITSSPLPGSWVTNGHVDAITLDGQGRAYIGGQFSKVGPRTGSALALTTASAITAPSFPDVDGKVDAIVSDGSGGWYLGGSFNEVGGLQRGRLAHILANGTVDPAWTPSALGNVLALALSGGSLYIGGDFNQVDGQAANELAKLSATGSGALDASFSPPSTVHGGAVLALAVVGSHVYAGGSAEFVGGGAFLNGFDAQTGEVIPRATWNPAPSNVVNALAASGTALFVGGAFDQMGADQRAGIAKVDTTGNGVSDPTWQPGSGATTVNALVVSNGGLYVGGDFTTIGGQNRHELALLSTSGSGAADAGWDPEADGPVDALALAGSDLVVGGSFAMLGGKALNGLGEVSATGAVTTAVDGWNPNPDGSVAALAASGTNVLAGGSFNSAGPQVTARSDLARLNPDGTLDTSWKVDVEGPSGIKAMLLDGGELYIGGGIVSVGGSARANLAKISTAGGGSADSSFTTGVGGPGTPEVDALALSGSTLYVAGSFATIGGQAVPDLAKLGTDGTVDPAWIPVTAPGTGAVRALAVSGGSVFAGSDFDVGFTAAATRLAKVAADGTGAQDTGWEVTPPNGAVWALTASVAGLYVGGDFTTIGGATRNRLALVATSGSGDADAMWNPNVDDHVYALALAGGSLYIGGAFLNVGGQFRGTLARVAAGGTGGVDPGFVPTTDSGGAVDAIASNASAVYVGGGFGGFGALSTANVAVFAIAPPVVTITSPADGATYAQGSRVTARYACSDPDGASDVTTCAGPVASGAGIDTSTLGSHAFVVHATDLASNTGSTTVTYTVADETPPTLSKLQIHPIKFKAAARGKVTAARKQRTPTGGRVTYRLSEPATVTFTVTTGKGKKHRKALGTFTVSGRAGANGFTFRGRVGGKKLRPASYMLSAVATDRAKNRAKNAVTVRFNIVAR